MDEAEDLQLKSETQSGEREPGGQDPTFLYTKVEIAIQVKKYILSRHKRAKSFQKFKNKRLEETFKQYKLRMTSRHCALKKKKSVSVKENEKKMDEAVDLPSTLERASSDQNPTVLFTEEEMATLAQQNILLRQKKAKSFQEYKNKWVEETFKKYKLRTTSRLYEERDKNSVTVTENKKEMDEAENLQLNYDTQTRERTSDGQDPTLLFTEQLAQAHQGMLHCQKMAKSFQEYKNKRGEENFIKYQLKVNSRSCEEEKNDVSVTENESDTQTGERASGDQKPTRLFTEEEMATLAQQNISLRKKMAKSFQRYKNKWLEPTFQKCQVSVTSNPYAEKEKISITVTENEKFVPLRIQNTGVERVYFTFKTFDFVKNIFTVKSQDGNIIKTIKDHLLRPGESYRMKIHFSSDHSGLYEQLLVFKFKRDCQHSETFDIMRLLEVIRQTPQNEDSQARSEVEKNFQTAKKTSLTGCEVFLRPMVYLRKYPLPKNVANIKDIDIDLEKKPLKWGNYSWRFHLLLYLEEYAFSTALEKCNQEDILVVTHQSEKRILILKAEDVSNMSNVVLTGCKALVTPLKQGDRIYKGWVDDVDEEQIYIRFEEIFPKEYNIGMRCSVVFSLQRIPLRMQHRAAALARKHLLRDLLFPVGLCSAYNSCLAPVIPKCTSPPMIVNNPEQQKAIKHILARSAKPAPYLIFGPPGTGKTVTLVEVIKQIVSTQDSKILVCAPSNSATDYLCEKILEENIVPHKVFRLYSISYKVEKIPQHVKMHCSFNVATNSFEIPTKGELMTYQIMVTTLQTAGRLVTGGIPPDHYSYIIVDEAGQAIETECLIPIAGLLKPHSGQVVLAGDPKQLGPIILSKIAERNGLGVSMLERLMTDIRLYKQHKINGFNSRYMTKLLRNYRSHPAILKIPNELFYDSELQFCSSLEDCLYSNWELLPRKDQDFPLMFHGVAGMKEQDLNSPSVYNMAEVDVLKEYLKSLIKYRRRNGLDKIGPKEIGIVTPYTKQVEKINAAFHKDKDLVKEDLENVLVGTVEIFQGKESDVILMSTVRSNPGLTAPNQHFSLGFVKDEKRFNVAMTRARSLLVVVGDPRVLEIDPVWNKLIHYCLRERAYRGINIYDLKAGTEVAYPLSSSGPQQKMKPKVAFSW
ncbi:putative helicase mov-10-B.1 [Xiphophorus maculatus]|uniref:putative helicase mov-10-B.1 n=1 Tax=Xiphophorus maculatus TaxID=8083 RepID=UPI0006D93D32|nr:putative helicase mov-10-B.1 [Xiphophorus maculatus]